MRGRLGKVFVRKIASKSHRDRMCKRPLRTTLISIEFQSLPDSPILDARTANDFFRRRRVRRDLWEECYDEGCDYEEVEESLSGHALVSGS